MPRFEPFAGLRYRTEQVTLDDVVAPPYDVVDDDERDRLVRRSPYNAVRLELPDEDPEHGLDRYQHAAALLDTWERDGIIRSDPEPALYVYAMTPSSASLTSTIGVIGAMGIDGAGGRVLPHERTTGEARELLLQLLKACQANLSPIWGLSLADGLTEACTKAISVAIDRRQATEDDGTRHEIWTVADKAAIARIAAVVEPAPVVVADGHHRLETATRFRDDRRLANANRPGDYDLVMALIVELAPEALSVAPIHRLVTDLCGVDLTAAIARHATLERVEGEASELTAQMAARQSLALVTAAGAWLVRPRPDRTDTGELDSSVADDLLAKAGVGEPAYQHGADVVVSAVRSGRAAAAILVRPATIAQIAETARRNETMPPKSTFFTPKPRTGMVFRSVSC